MRILSSLSKLAGSNHTGKILIYGLGLSVLCLVITLSILSLNKQYMGVDICLEGEVWKVTSVDPNGLAQADGINPGDTVTAVNGRDPSEFAATSDRLPRVGIETLSIMDAEGTTKFISIYGSPLPASTLTEGIGYLFIGLLFWGVGIWVVLKKPDSKAARQLYLSSLAVCVVCMGMIAYSRNIVGAQHIQIVTLTILVPLLLHLFLIFPKPRQLKLRNHGISGTIYLPALAMLLVYGLWGYKLEAYYTWFRPLISAYLTMGLLTGLGILIHSYFTSTYSRIKQQTKIIASGAFIGLLPTVSLIFIPDSLTGSFIVAPQFTLLTIVFIPVAVAYAIVQHQLLDIDFYLSRTIVYGGIILALIASYIILTFGLTQIMDALTETQRISIIIALSCLIIVIFPLVKTKIEHRVDKVFYKDRYDYRQTLRWISAALSSTTDINALSNFVTSSISNTLGLSGACLFIKDKNGRLKLSEASGVYDGEEELPDLLQQIKTLKDVDKFPEKAPADLGVEFVVPLKSGNKETGVLCLSRKLSRADFSVDDIYFVSTFATQAATAIENAILLDKTKADSIELRTMYQQLEEHTASLGRSKEQLEEAYVAMATTLIVALEARDPYTRGHTERVVHLARGIGVAMKLSKSRLRLLELAGRFHDVGKINIPDSILLKPDVLNPFEIATVQTHPQKATEMLRFLPMLQDALSIIEAHHEWYNGQGYPRGLKGKGIPLESRILAVADAYDAMTSERAYRRAFSHEDAIRRLEEGVGTQWDPQVIEAFVNICSA